MTNATWCINSTHRCYLLIGAKKMVSGNDHGEDAYGILELDVNTENIDGMMVNTMSC